MKLMGKIAEIWENVFTRILIGYIQFVYKTSKVVEIGNKDFLLNNNNEKFIVGFWHGNSYCAYPVLKDRGVYIITTINKRGDYITNIGEHFGYIPIRLPDDGGSGGNNLSTIRKMINETKNQHIALTLDGPLGPYHIPKKFALQMALLTKRKILPISIKVNMKIRLTARWDKYLIPLPFSKIELHFHNPLEVKRNELDKTGEKIIEIMQ